MPKIGVALSLLLTLTRHGLSAPANISSETVTELHSVAEQMILPYLYPPIVLPADKRQAVDNTCGKRNGTSIKCNALSPGGGPCCSSFGYCGHGNMYCGKGCQSEYGVCGHQVPTIRHKRCGPKHQNRKCPVGECCSSHGKCGRSKKFCGKHCQPEYGTCYHSVPTTPTYPQTRCGKDFQDMSCSDGKCCSASGWCGRGPSFCSVPQNCQRAFGMCDSDIVPSGFDLSPMSQPRPRVGKVPYGQVIKHCLKPRTVALTFDDGPSDNTIQILNTLWRYGAKATFFISGITNGKGEIDRSQNWIAVLKRMALEGHQIGSHSWSHPNLNNVSRDTRLNEMIRNDRAIANILGKFPTYMRPPYLECSDKSGCLKDMTNLGYHVVGYDVDSHDWENKSLEDMKKHVDAALSQKDANGNMLLIQHDTNRNAAALTEHVLEKIKDKKWNAVTLGECLNDPAVLWYNEPIWVGASTIAKGGLQYGCAVSEKGFCGTLQPFKGERACYISHQSCSKRYEICKSQLGGKHRSCGQYGQMCWFLQRFCDQCNKGHAKPCDDKWFSFNRLYSDLQV